MSKKFVCAHGLVFTVEPINFKMVDVPENEHVPVPVEMLLTSLTDMRETVDGLNTAIATVEARLKEHDIDIPEPQEDNIADLKKTIANILELMGTKVKVDEVTEENEDRNPVKKVVRTSPDGTELTFEVLASGSIGVELTEKPSEELLEFIKKCVLEIDNQSCSKFH